MGTEYASAYANICVVNFGEKHIFQKIKSKITAISVTFL